MLKLNLLTVLFILTISSFNSFPQEKYYGSIIKPDGFGNSYAAGSFKSESITFGSFNLVNKGSDDLFLAKYNPEGKVVWVKGIGGKGNESIVSMDVDYNGTISLSASSNSKDVYLDNSRLSNNNQEIILNAEFTGRGDLVSAEIIQEINRSRYLKYSGNDTTISIISPAANDNWKVGTRVVLKWEFENVEFVRIELSTDNGATWNHISATIANFDEYPIIAPNTPSDSCLIKISDYYNPEIADTSGLFTISGILYWTVKSGNYNSVLTSVFNINSGTTIAAGFNGLSKTTDNGTTWVKSLEGTGLFDVYFLNDNLGWAAGFNGNIFKTTNGGITWLQQNSPLNYHLLKIYFYDEDNGYMISDRYFIKTTNGGESWTLSQPTSHILRAMFFINKDIGWIAGGEGVIFKTTDAGLNWTCQQLNGTDYGTLTSLLFTDEQSGFASGSGLNIDGGVVLKTSNSGSQWQLNHNGYNRFIYSISFSSPDSGWIVGNEGIMFNTTNGGLNWELQGSGTLADLHDIALNPDNTGWSVGDDGVILKFVYDSVSNPVPVEIASFSAKYINNRVNLNWSTVSEINNKGFEIQRLQNSGFTGQSGWEKIGFVEGKGTTTEVQNYQFRDIGLQAGKYSYRLKQVDFDGSFEFSNTVEINIGLPDKFTLEQNYPNPFNPATKIKYIIPDVIASGAKQSQLVTLKVYDILGKEIATLVNEEKPAGTYEVEFTAGDLSSGIYFYQLKAGNFIQTKKMQLVK